MEFRRRAAEVIKTAVGVFFSPREARGFAVEPLALAAMFTAQVK